jgi:tRNA(fMet)-specific endonuclease VapC
MILLDTDHLSVHAFPDSQTYAVLSARMRNARDDFGTTIICLEEQLRGWLAAIKQKHDVDQQVMVYDQLANLWDYYRDWQILRFDARSAEIFKRFRQQRIRIGSQDLKIAAIALTNNALLLSANLRDFRQIPGCCQPICVISAKSPACEWRIGCSHSDVAPSKFQIQIAPILAEQPPRESA